MIVTKQQQVYAIIERVVSAASHDFITVDGFGQEQFPYSIKIGWSSVGLISRRGVVIDAAMKRERFVVDKNYDQREIPGNAFAGFIEFGGVAESSSAERMIQTILAAARAFGIETPDVQAKVEDEVCMFTVGISALWGSEPIA